jgi:hypothetical protein
LTQFSAGDPDIFLHSALAHPAILSVWILSGVTVVLGSSLLSVTVKVFGVPIVGLQGLILDLYIGLKMRGFFGNATTVIVEPE